MPWRDVTRMEQKLEMIEKWRSGMYRKGELAEISGVSRPTLNKWIARYELEGEKGLEDRSRRPKTSPNATSEEVVERLVRLKRANPERGPNKLRAWLINDEPEQKWPSASTIGTYLDRHGLVQKRRKRNRRSEGSGELVEPFSSGEMMTADYKGEFRVGNGQYCYPLTIFDPVSRYAYAVDGHDSTSFANARKSFERVFREYGLPRWIKTDNGVPFSMAGSIRGISRLSVWWIKLGIEPVRIRKGCPWQNGRHERMHRTLKAHTTRPPQADLLAQQRSFEEFLEDYNHDRPHEALEGQVPSSLLLHSERAYPRRVPSVEYPGHFEVRKVHSSGMIKLKGQETFLSEVLAGEFVGLEEIDESVWSVRFSTIELGRWDLRRGVFV